MLVLDRIVARWHLKQHPFYEAWSAGTLPAEALRHYAGEWGAFIGAVPAGWRTLGVEEHAREEEEHAALWEEFASDLGATVDRDASEGVARELTETARRLFGERETAIGALYAFEAQQPETARAKADGLRRHYAHLGTPGRYFAVHADDYGEAAMLEAMAAALSPEGQRRAAAACDVMGRALWEALTAVQQTAPTAP